MSALRRVLVVDDDPVVGSCFDRVLTKDKGYVVITAQNGAEALEKMSAQKYDLVFTDVVMPGMDGVALAEHLRATQPWLPVVIITGAGTPSQEARAKAAGVHDFMRKPLSPAMIEGSASQALRVAPPATAPVALVASVEAKCEVVADPTPKSSGIKNVTLFLLAPFIGLIYALLLPLVGMGVLAWMGGKALLGNKKLMQGLKRMGLFFAAPFIGLAYAVALPFVGLGMLAWVGAQALLGTLGYPQGQGAQAK